MSRGEEVRRLLEVGKHQGNESIKFIKVQLKSVISLPGDMAKTLHLKTSESCGKFSEHVMKRPRTYSCSAKMETNSNRNDGLRKRTSCEEAVDCTLVRSQSAPLMRMDSTAAVAGLGQGEQCRPTTSSLCSRWLTESGSLLKLLRLVA